MMDAQVREDLCLVHEAYQYFRKVKRKTLQVEVRAGAGAGAGACWCVVQLVMLGSRPAGVVIA